ncbi:MAG: hypothetical protein JWQ96_2202 [Segetibacter sp.]|nr:hypothetical protein [Segetibacter sp.]
MNYKFSVLAVCLLLLYTISQAQENDTLLPKGELQEVVVSASKFNERNSKVTVSIRTINQRDFKKLNLSNTANLLESSGLAFVQKSQQGGGSPIIRGFEASRVLLMVDGIRMNNAIYRAGHLQNIITVDPNILQRMEILYGPSSTLYGSDALGGVVNMFTKNPVFATGRDTTATNAAVRYSSAIDEKMGHADFMYGGKNWGSFTSVTYTDFGDLVTGKHRDDKYASFGLFPYYVQRINGADSAIQNPDQNKMVGSGYTQWDVLQKFLFKGGNNTTHSVNIQLSGSSNLPRFDRLTELANGLPRYGDWYYGPQKRYVGSYKLEKVNMKAFFQEARIIASFQNIEESRFDRRFKQAIRNERIEKANVGGLTIDARRRMNDHEFVTGADVQLNFINSTARGYNVNNGSISKITTRYPDGDNQMHYAAVYGQHTWKITDKLTLNDGLRLNFTGLKSTFNDTSLLHLPFTDAKQNNLAVSGNVGLVFSPDDQFKIATVFSTGFRAPNIDDLTKVFDTRSGAVVVPNAGLKPEYTYNAELNLVKYFPVHGNDFGARIGGSIFYTWFSNAIVTDRFTFNGRDSIIYQGVNSAVFASQNKAKANLFGYSIYGGINMLPALELNGTVTYTEGQYINETGAEFPLDHIPPVFGRVGLKYEKNRLYAEAYTLFNGWKRIEDYNPSGEDNPQYATAEGMPSWYTLNARFNYNLHDKLVLQLAVENIADQQYRTFASGISAPGRNFIVGLKAGF